MLDWMGVAVGAIVGLDGFLLGGCVIDVGPIVRVVLGWGIMHVLGVRVAITCY